MKKPKIYEMILIISLIYYLLEVFLLKWLCFDYSIKFCSIIIIAALTTIILLNKKGNIIIKFKEIIIYYVFIMYILLNWIFTEKHTYIYSELVYYTLTPICILLFFKLFAQKEELYNKWFKNIIPKVLNIYFLINVPILIMQTKGTGFLMRGFTSEYSNQFYVDHISGLLGLDGTHKLTLFTISVVLANVFKSLENKENKYLWYAFLEIVFSLYISTYNDNKALYFIMPVMLFPIILYGVKKAIKNKKIEKLIFIAMIIIFSIIGLYFGNEKIRDELDTKIFTVFNKDESGGIFEQERIALFKYALENGNGYKMGMGIGSIQLFGDPNLPRHFGISDISSRTYEGGIIYVLLWILLLSQIIYSSICVGKRDIKVKICIIISVTVFFVYEQITTEWNQVFLIGLMYMMYKNIYDTIREKKDRSEICDLKN